VRFGLDRCRHHGPESKSESEVNSTETRSRVLVHRFTDQMSGSTLERPYRARTFAAGSAALYLDFRNAFRGAPPGRGLWR